jgi:Holliday junction resolvase RusA-like endonuclease
MQIVIPGKPIAKARPKFARRGKFVTTYNPQESEEGKWITQAIGQIPEVVDGPILLRCWFSMPIPKSASKKAIAGMVSGDIQHTKKPDLDNLVKFVKDCLNGIAWKDDSQVVKMIAAKGYSAAPFTMVEISEFCKREAPTHTTI